jgi:hypothetical protein
MWNRRRFLEMVSGLPLVGDAIGATTLPAVTALAAKRDYFRDPGVRPFINAAGTYTAMTSSLMPCGWPEGQHYVCADDRSADDRSGRPSGRLRPAGRFGILMESSRPLWMDKEGSR